MSFQIYWGNELSHRHAHTSVLIKQNVLAPKTIASSIYGTLAKNKTNFDVLVVVMTTQLQFKILYFIACEVSIDVTYDTL